MLAWEAGSFKYFSWFSIGTPILLSISICWSFEDVLTPSAKALASFIKTSLVFTTSGLIYIFVSSYTRPSPAFLVVVFLFPVYKFLSTSPLSVSIPAAIEALDWSKVGNKSISKFLTGFLALLLHSKLAIPFSLNFKYC